MNKISSGEGEQGEALQTSDEKRGAINKTVETQKTLRVLVACEFSGVVRDAFAERGHDADSCDWLETEIPGQHYKGDVFALLDRTHRRYDLMIAHPPCTYLAVSGARWFKNRQYEQNAALRFVKRLLGCYIQHIALENPISIISSRIRKPDQIIQPWQFGHGETKATCLWLKNLPKLVPTDIVAGREARVHRASPGPDRWKERSRTLLGIAQAMAKQWGDFCVSRMEKVENKQPCLCKDGKRECWCPIHGAKPSSDATGAQPLEEKEA